MSSRNELLTELQELSYPQFEEVLSRLKIEPWNIPGAYCRAKSEGAGSY